MLRMRGQFSDADVQDVTALALAGLVSSRPLTWLRDPIGGPLVR